MSKYICCIFFLCVEYFVTENGQKKTCNITIIYSSTRDVVRSSIRALAATCAAATVRAVKRLVQPPLAMAFDFSSFGRLNKVCLFVG